MPGFKYSMIFKSRWAALAFAASVCWMAANVAGGSDDTRASDPATIKAEADNDRAIQEMAGAEKKLDDFAKQP